MIEGIAFTSRVYRWIGHTLIVGLVFSLTACGVLESNPLSEVDKNEKTTLRIVRGDSSSSDPSLDGPNTEPLVIWAVRIDPGNPYTRAITIPPFIPEIDIIVPNGNYLVFAYTTLTAFLQGPPRCVFANGGNPVTLNGEDFFLPLNMRQGECGIPNVFFDSFVVPIKFHACATLPTAAVTACDGTTGNPSSGSNYYSMRFVYIDYIVDEFGLNVIGPGPAHTDCYDISAGSPIPTGGSTLYLPIDPPMVGFLELYQSPGCAGGPEVVQFLGGLKDEIKTTPPSKARLFLDSSQAYWHLYFRD